MGDEVRHAGSRWVRDGAGDVIRWEPDTPPMAGLLPSPTTVLESMIEQALVDVASNVTLGREGLLRPLVAEGLADAILQLVDDRMLPVTPRADDVRALRDRAQGLRDTRGPNWLSAVMALLRDLAGLTLSPIDEPPAPAERAMVKDWATAVGADDVETLREQVTRLRGDMDASVRRETSVERRLDVLEQAVTLPEDEDDHPATIRMLKALDVAAVVSTSHLVAQHRRDHPEPGDRIGHHHRVTTPYHLGQQESGEPHKGVNVHEDARTWPGSVLEGGVGLPTCLQAHASIGNDVLIGHEAIISSHAEVATRSVVGAHSVIAPYAKVGLNVTIKPFTRVGRGARIGNGSNVMHDVPANQLWHGNPAKFSAHLCKQDGCYAKVAEAGMRCRDCATRQPGGITELPGGIVLEDVRDVVARDAAASVSPGERALSSVIARDVASGSSPERTMAWADTDGQLTADALAAAHETLRNQPAPGPVHPAG